MQIVLREDVQNVDKSREVAALSTLRISIDIYKKFLFLLFQTKLARHTKTRVGSRSIQSTGWVNSRGLSLFFRTYFDHLSILDSYRYYHYN